MRGMRGIFGPGVFLGIAVTSCICLAPEPVRRSAAIHLQTC